MSTCKPTNEVLKDLRAMGSTPAQLKAVQELLNKVRTDAQASVDVAHTQNLSKMYKGKEISVQFNGRSLTGKVNWIVGYKDDTVKVNIDLVENGKEYTMIIDNEGKSKNSSAFLPQFVNSKAQVNYEISNAGEKVLGSTKKASSTKKKRAKFERIEKDLHGNIEAMQNLIDELVLIDKEITSEHKEYLKGLIGSLNPKFFRNMTTYITTKANETGGTMVREVTKKGNEINSIELSISKARHLAGNQQSAAEVYTHEVIHSYVAFALDLARSGDVEARKLQRELEFVMKRAREKMTWKDLLPENSINPELEEKNAKEMYDYIFNSENAEDEFIAHVLTNPIVMKKVESIKLKEDKQNKSLLKKIRDLFATMMDLFAGNYEFRDGKKNLKEMTLNLTMRLAEYNNRTVKELQKNEGISDKILDLINDSDDALAEKIEAMVDKYLPSGVVGPKPEDPVAKAKWVSKVMASMIVNPIYRNQLSKMASAFGMPPDGSIQTLMRDFFDSDDLSKSVDFIGLAADRIDGFKMSLIGTVKEAIEKGFKDKLTKEDKRALLKVVADTDLVSIIKKKGQYKNAEIRAILDDEAELDRRISRAKHALKEKDPTRYFWHVNQASGLGYYLATGKAHIAQNLNSVNIARGLLSAEYKSFDGELLRLIDEVSTLTALKYTDRNLKIQVADLMKRDWRGVANVLNTLENLKEEARKSVFSEGTTHIIKGYTKEVFDDRITMEIAPITDKLKMERKGFKFVKALDKHSGDTTGLEFGMFVSNSFSTSEWYRTATRLTKLNSKGTDLQELMYAGDSRYTKLKHKTAKVKLDTARINMVTEMMKGEIDLTKQEYGLVPVLNSDGGVVDYRYMMDKESKEDFLGMSGDISDVLARTKAHIFDKTESVKHNDKLLDIIKEDAKNNYISGSVTGRNDRQYVLITDNTNDEKIKDLWRVLPRSFKEEAMNRADKGLPVRADLVNSYFGYRHLSITNFPLLSQITPEVIKNLIKIAETLWMEFIKISKIDVLVKMPFVVVGNIISNFMYGLLTGTGPRELLKMYTESTRDVRAYLKKHRELIELKNAKATGNLRKLPIENIPQLERELKTSPIHELYELGIYQAIVEDVSKEDFTSTNKLKQWYKDKTEKVPTMIKDGLNWIYLTEETQYYKVVTEIVQMSDLVARDIENRKLKAITEKQLNGTKRLPRWWLELHPETKGKKLNASMRAKFKTEADKRRLDTVLNAFVNYNKPSGAIEEYLNKIGLIMFTKYAKRIQRVIGTTGVRYPIKSLLLLLGQEFIMDVETIQDQSIFTRSWYNLGLSENDLIPGKPLWDYLMEVYYPPILQASTYRLI